MAGRFRRLWNILGLVHPGAYIMGGQFTITGGAGALTTDTTTDGALISGGTVVKNAAAGRYDIAFYRTARRVIAHGVQMVGPDSAAFPTTTGSDPQLRLVTGAGMTVQFKRTDTQADANPAAATVCRWWALVSDR